MNMATRIIDLPKSEWRARCLADANKCGELNLHFQMLEDDGEDVDAMPVARILKEARYALEFFEDSGTASDECERGDRQALRERREMQRFVAKWSKLHTERVALLAAREAAN